MAQGRPPRRSTTKRDPVTIDLEAEKKPEGSEPKTGAARPSSEDPAVVGPPTAPAPSQGKTESRAAASAETAATAKPEPKPAEASAGPERTAGEAKGVSDKAATAPKTETAAKGDGKPAADGPTKEARPATEAPKTGTRSSAAPTSSSSGTGRAFGAGLLGGIIVIGLAFALESTGILPAPGSRSSAGTNSAVANLSSEVDGLKKSVADMKGAGDAASRTVQMVRDLQGRVKSLSAELDQLKGAAQSGGTNAEAVNKELADANARLDDLSKKVSALQASAGQGARETRLAAIVAATALKSAVDRGGTFASELKVYESIVPSDKSMAPLAKLAAEGVPSRAELVDEFSGAADAIMSAVRGNSADSSVFDRLLNSARSMIKVRPTGDIPGKSASAVVARMGFKLKKGDLKGVVDEWQSLPEAGQKASQSFIDKVKMRMTAEQAAEAALQQASAPTDNQG